MWRSAKSRRFWLANCFICLSAFLVLAGASCGETEVDGNSGPQATLQLMMPPSPLGLHYGEQATLLLRYRKSGQPTAGVTLSLHIDGDTTGSGATLSADRVITNGEGDASVLLTAGAAESAFHIICSAPLAVDLSVDVAVSKYAFGNLDVLVDATEVPGDVEVLRAALITGTHCSALLPTPKLGPVLRGGQASERRAELPFPTLLVQPYSVIGRAAETTGRLLAYGCVDISDELLRTGIRAVVPVPLSLVFPSALGSYKLDLKLKSKPAAPLIFETLACSDGLGQAVLDALLPALLPADSDLSMRLSVLRSTADATGCRTGSGKLDDRLHILLAATTAGSSLSQLSPDVAALQKSFDLASELDVTVATGQNLLGTHTLKSATLSTGTRMANYSLATVPVPAAEDLLLTQSGAALLIPEHGVTLRLPSLWRKALDELVLVPRGVSMSPQQLLQSAVTTAQSGAASGCDAVEAVLCMGVAAPCAGHLKTACMTASTNVGMALTSALADLPPQLDFFLTLTLTLEDPDGTLEAQTLSAGQLDGRVTTVPGTMLLTGSATGTRQ